MARAAAPIFSGFRVATSTTRRLSRCPELNRHLLINLSRWPEIDRQLLIIASHSSTTSIVFDIYDYPFYGALPCIPLRAAPATSALAVHPINSARIEVPPYGDQTAHPGGTVS